MFTIIGSIKAIYLSRYLIFTVACIWFSSHHPFPPWMQFKSLLNHWTAKLYTVLFRLFSVHLLCLFQGFYYIYWWEMSNIISRKRAFILTSFSWLRSFRLLVDNNLVDSSISVFMKYVYIRYTRNYLKNLDRSKEEFTISIFLSSKCIWFGWSLYIEMMLCGASASGRAPVRFKG